MSLLWKYVCGGMAFLCIMLGIRLYMETRHSAKLQAQVVKLSAELQRISTAKDEQGKTTGANIKQAEKQIVYVDRVVTKLENRPIKAEGCETPDLQEWKEIL